METQKQKSPSRVIGSHNKCLRAFVIRPGAFVISPGAFLKSLRAFVISPGAFLKSLEAFLKCPRAFFMGLGAFFFCQRGKNPSATLRTTFYL
jgi:hypothetical protein